MQAKQHICGAVTQSISAISTVTGIHLDGIHLESVFPLLLLRQQAPDKQIHITNDPQCLPNGPKWCFLPGLSHSPYSPPHGSPPCSVRSL